MKTLIISKEEHNLVGKKFFEDQGIPTIVDPKSPNWQRYSGCSVITPNLKEFFAVVGEKMSESEIVTAAHILTFVIVANLMLE